MSLAYNIFINTNSIIILIVICIYFLKQNETTLIQNKIYMMMLQITIILLLFDIFSRFDGNHYTAFSVFNHAGNFTVFLLSPVLPSLWLLYVYNHVFGQDRRIRQLLYLLLAVNAAHALMLILSMHYGWFYYIDRDNIYHRGPLFILSASVTVILLIASFAFIMLNRKRIDSKHFFPLLFFAVPPFVYIFVQIIFYGISIMINSVVISLLIAFLNTQTRSIYIDYLTGLNNRMKLEFYMKEKVSKCMRNKTFSAIMIDLDNFKYINDTFGHKMGDEALQIYAKLLERCLRSDDFIARFGGDEFCIVLDSSDAEDLKKIAGRINCCVEKFNSTGDHPYKITMSMGYAVYDYDSHMEAEDFQKLIDRLMYEEKHSKEKDKSI